MYIEHPGFVLWFTGLSGAGKTSLSMALQAQFQARMMRVERLDGDVVRQQLTRDLGFSKADRDTNIERVTFVAKLLSRNNVAVMAAFISPYAVMRDYARRETTNFIEIYVDAPLEICIERDTKGLYSAALAGEIPNFTGINDPYEAPHHPDIHLRTDLYSVDECTHQILEWLEERSFIPVRVQS